MVAVVLHRPQQNFLVWDPHIATVTTKLLNYEHKRRLVLHDPETKSYDLIFTAKSIEHPHNYFQSLISVS